MFYEESKISKVLNCELCNRKYDEPRLLPCGSTVCNICVCNIEDNLLISSSTCFKCIFCSEHHCVPQGGFPINKQIKKLMNEKPNEIYRGRDAEIFKANLNEVQIQISELEQNILKGIDKIKDHCHQLRVQVQQATNEKFEELNKMSACLIKQIDSYEKECIQNAINVEEYKQSFDERITVISKFIDENKTFLYQCNISESEILEANEMFKIFKLKLEDEMTSINDFTFNYSLMEFEPNKSKINEASIGTMRYHQLGKQISTNQLRKIALGECLEDKSDDSPVLTEVGEFNHYYVAYFNKKNEVIIVAYDHAENIKIEKNLISNCRNLFQFRKFNSNLALSYQKENSECCIVILDEQLNIIRRNDDFCQFIIGENLLYMYCFNPINALGVRVYDENLHIVEFNQHFQSQSLNEPFFFSDDLKRLKHTDHKYIWLDSIRLNILNDKSGELIVSLPIQADTFEINSKNDIVCLLRSELKLKYFDFFGNLLREIDLSGFEMSQNFHFKIDK